MSKSKEIAAKQETALALAEDFEADSGLGFEGADADAYAIPFLIILQSGSPQVKRTSGAYIDGAQEGMLMNTVDHELFNGEEGVQFIPCFYRRAFVEWVPRTQGGGYVGEYAPGSQPPTRRNEMNRDELENGNELVDTRYHYGLLRRADGTTIRLVISMAVTQVKKSRRWMTQMQGIKFPRKDGRGTFTPPMYSHAYTLKVVPESNDDNSWWNWEIAGKEVVQDPWIIAEARAFMEAIKGGQVREAHESNGAGGTASSTGGAPAEDFPEESDQPSF